MVSILEALATRNVRLTSYTSTGPNSNVTHELRVQNWTPWREFTYRNLTRIFKDELAMPYDGSRDPQPLEQDLEVNNEETLEFCLSRFVIPTVNYALRAQRALP